jgi:hypothetical protein
MNERIKELMGKTLDDKFSHTWTTMTYEDLEKFSEQFAELIVRECIEVIEKQKAKMSYGPTFVIEDIKQHFGVEK